ncbi:MAG: NAD(P)H-binding protein [Rhodospirillaceae bacterium]
MSPITHADDLRAIPGSTRRVFVLGGTGTIGRATVRALVQRSHEVICFIRKNGESGESARMLDGATLRFGDVTNPASLANDGFKGENFDVLVSCLASRTGAPKDAWAIDYEAHVHALALAKASGVGHMILLSAICVQKPRLAFQYSKLAFEAALIESGLVYSIVRPTAYFKSLSGQIERVKDGKPFLVFGDGLLTACKPISDADLGAYIAECLDNEDRQNKVLPIGGPGEAVTPKQQGERLFALLGRKPRFRHVPISLLDAIVGGLTFLSRIFPSLEAKAELARIGRYYATESMVVLDPATGLYNADATPSFGTDTLFDFYARVINGTASVERGEHSLY